MSENIWFTSDTHFHHKGILRFARGQDFSDVNEMTEHLIEQWNARIQPGDRVYHLGDFSLGKRGQTEETIGRLQGQLHVVRGNHDHGLDVASIKDRLASYSSYKEISIGDQKVCMSHFPFLTWNRAHHGSWMLHGHSHGLLEPTSQPRYDVGVDPNGYAPISFDELQEVMRDRIYEPVDAHRPTA